MKIDIIIPWIRPHLIMNVKHLAIKNAGFDVSNINLHAVQNVNMISVNTFFNQLVDETKGDYIVFLADDCIPQPNWLRNALEAFQGNVKFVMMNDGNNVDRPGHFIFKRDLLPLLGGKLAHEGYYHCYADNEIIDRTRELGVYTWSKDALVIHNHPMFNKEVETDEHYQKAYSPEVMGKDRRLYEARKAAGWPDTNEGLKLERKVAIGVASTGEIQTITTKCLILMYEHMQRSGLTPKFIYAFAQVETARNMVVERAQTLGCTHLLFIDSDAEFPPDTANVLLEADKKIIGCNAAKKISETPVIQYNAQGEELDYIMNQIDEVSTIGMHVTMIDMTVFDGWKPPWFYPLPWNDSPILAGEDFVFCKKSNQRIYCHLELSMRIGHIVWRDRIVYLEPHIRKQIEARKKQLEVECWGI